MRFLTPLVAALAGSAIAAPFISDLEKRGGWCISEKDAQKAADIFQELIQDYSNKLALEALTPDYEDWSSSVNIIINLVSPEHLPLLGPTFVGRAAFIAGQGTQPHIPFKQLGVVYGCDSVSLRWYTSDSAAGQPTKSDSLPVVGNVFMHVVKAAPGDAYNFRIKATYSEFDSAAWLINLGELYSRSPFDQDLIANVFK